MPARRIDIARAPIRFLTGFAEPTRDIEVGIMLEVNATTLKIAPARGEEIAPKRADRPRCHAPPWRDRGGALPQGWRHGRVEPFTTPAGAVICPRRIGHAWRRA